ncbi:GNAT family N-acetyltransferase [Ilumatobacter sp.]|uniref:GNAT family N-acetyltransferase n=1 Tax=Ilumatobacter sp. TaxID=1967498 RepID=UPI003AF94AD0
MELRWPHERMLDDYVAALRTGWSPNTMRPEAAHEELERIAEDAGGFVDSLVDRGATGPPIRQPDGSLTPRLPGYRKWMWDGAFSGTVNFRWQPGTNELPAHVPGHIGYSVVPWKRRRGYATQAVAAILDDARAEGLTEVEITTDLDNIGSQRVIEHNGGVLVERFEKSGADGAIPSLRYRVDLTPA